MMSEKTGKRGRKLYLMAGGALLLAMLLALFLYRRSTASLLSVSPRRGPIIEAVYGIGSITSSRMFNLKIGVMNTLERSYVKEGDSVRRGDPMVKLAGIPIFRAPFDGVITSLPFSPGETLFPQIPILTLIDPADRYLSVVLEQEGALRVRRGQKARFSFESIRGNRFEGVVRSIYPSAGQFKVNIEVRGLPDKIMPGMTADVAIEVSRKENVLLIPVSSIYGGRVTVIREGKKRKVDVEVGSMDGEWAEVISGEIRPDDQIVLRKELKENP